jgi:hypothetical protein
MEGEIIIEGKKYISSRRFSKENGYTNDYLSKLCRDGKVEGMLIGRSWFLFPDSFFELQKSLKTNRLEKRIKKTEEGAIHDIETNNQEDLHEQKKETIDIVNKVLTNKEEVKTQKTEHISEFFKSKELMSDISADFAKTIYAKNKNKMNHSGVIPKEIVIAIAVGITIFIASFFMESVFSIESSSKNYSPVTSEAKLEFSF